MELREAGSGNMLSVEKKLEREKAKAQHRLRQIANASERGSVFDFINSKLTKTSGQDSKGGSSTNNSSVSSPSQSLLFI